MINNMTGYVTGDLKVHQRGFHDDREMNIALAERWNLTEEVSAVAGVAATTPRVTGHALASREDQSRALQVMGVDSATEPRVTRLDRSIVRGRYLERGNEILVGVDAAGALDVSPGDELVLVVQASDGSIGADRFEWWAYSRPVSSVLMASWPDALGGRSVAVWLSGAVYRDRGPRAGC